MVLKDAEIESTSARSSEDSGLVVIWGQSVSTRMMI